MKRISLILLLGSAVVGGAQDSPQGPAAVAASGPVASPTAAATPLSPRPAALSYVDDPRFVKAVAEAKERKPMPADEHLARWKNASRAARGECVECLHQMIVLQGRMNQWKDVIKSAEQLDAVATEPKEKYFAESERGMGFMHLHDGSPKPDELKQADLSLAAALGLVPKSKNVLFAEGRTLAMLGRDEEAKKMFGRYLEVASYSDTYRTRVEHFAENPRLAALNMAPAFTLTTSEGEQMALDDMNGKVVLLDFWATWCGPCKESLPEVKKIAKDFAGQPLVVISISIDRDEMAWKNFIAKNEMDWPQYRDANSALSTAYGAQSIPRYFTIDTDGVLQSIKVGSGSDPESDVRRLIKKAQDAERKKAKASETKAGE